MRCSMLLRLCDQIYTPTAGAAWLFFPAPCLGTHRRRIASAHSRLRERTETEALGRGWVRGDQETHKKRAALNTSSATACVFTVFGPYVLVWRNWRDDPHARTHRRHTKYNCSQEHICTRIVRVYLRYWFGVVAAGADAATIITIIRAKTPRWWWVSHADTRKCTQTRDRTVCTRHTWTDANVAADVCVRACLLSEWVCVELCLLAVAVGTHNNSSEPATTPRNARNVFLRKTGPVSWFNK